MESVGFFLEEEWESLSRMFTEEADFMAHLHGHDKRDDSFWFGTGANIDDRLFYSSDTLIANSNYFSQENSNKNTSNSVFFPTQNQEIHCFSDPNHVQEANNSLKSMDFSVMDSENNLLVPIFRDEEILCPKEEERMAELGNADSDQPANVADPGNELLLKRKNNDSSETTPKKKSWVSRNGKKDDKKNAASKKSQKRAKNGNDEDETIDVGTNGQSSSSYSSEGDSNASHEEINVGAVLNSNGKTRASRGAATHPQSLYARRRRERINERLRILQNLVPNGTKVDISTMLEEAVQYVKFLQLQIKLLSSEDTWMFAPIAYNGMDMGLYCKISPTL